MKYHIWTIGCQMNSADSLRLGATLEALGCQVTADVQQADIIVLNTCVVRQSAEDRATGFLWSLKPLKERRPATVIALMGCMVGVKGNGRLRETFPHVDVLMAPGDPATLIEYLREMHLIPPLLPPSSLASGGGAHAARDHSIPPACGATWDDVAHTADNQPILPARDGGRASWPQGETSMPCPPARGGERGGQQEMDPTALPLHLQGRLVSAPVPVLLGCNHVCSYCVIPARRGRERSRRPEHVLAEVQALAAQGVREVVLLGQIVDRYGLDLEPGMPRLPDLLADVSQVKGVERVRFLTSHPAYFDQRLIDAMRTLPKVCEHIEVPIQSGDDDVLKRMRRGHTVDDYRHLIRRIREQLPGCSIATDVIVGFPGETDKQFQTTLDVLAELHMDVCHVAMYSPRPDTLAAKTMPDDVPPREKKRRLDAVNALQEQIAAKINRRLLGQRVEILVEGRQKGKWRGRTRTNKLVFFENDDRDWRGRLVQVDIAWSGPWSMQAELAAGSTLTEHPAPGAPAAPGGRS